MHTSLPNPFSTRYDIDLKCFFSDSSIHLAPYIHDPKKPASSPSLPAMVSLVKLRFWSRHILTPLCARARLESDLRHFGAHETVPCGVAVHHSRRYH